MKYFSTTLLLLATVIATTFAQTTNHVVFSFDHMAGTSALKLNQTVFPIWNNKNVIITRAQFYISEVELHQADGTKISIKDQYLLVNANTGSTEFDLGNWPVEALDGVTLHIGVPDSVNHLDPATYPDNHPLAMQNPTMYWGWTSGYRFLVIDGKVDNNGDGIPESEFQFHNLGDALYKSLELTGVQTAENGVLHLHFKIDYVQLFKNLAMTGNLLQHGSEPLNALMMDNAATPQFLSMVGTTATQQVADNESNIKALPNPANDGTTLKYNLPASGNVTLVLTNALGQVVRTIPELAASGELRLETAMLSEGAYQYTFYQNGNLIACKQLIVKH